MLNIQKINARFRSIGEVVLRLRWLNILIFLAAMAVAVGGLRLLESDVSQENWFLEDDVLLQTKERFEEIFGNDEFCAVLVEAEDVFAPDILAGIRELGRELMERVPYADDVLSLTDFEFMLGTDQGMEIIDLVPEVVPTSSEELARIRALALAKPAMRDRIVSEDGRHTWVMLRMKTLPDAWEGNGGESPNLTVGRMVNEIAAQDKYRALNPKTTGLPVVDVEKREFFSRETPRLLGISLLLTVTVLAVSLRSVRGVVFPLIAAVSGMVIVFGTQGYLGISNDPSMIFLPIFLCLALAIGYSIHLFNFFKREFLRTGKRRHSLVHAVEEVGWPLLFSALTTIAALLSFVFIPMRPIRWVGLTAACLVAVTYVLVIVLLPSLLSFGKDVAPGAAGGRGRGLRPLERLMEYLGARVLSCPLFSVVAFALVAVVCLVGLARLEVSFDVRRTMGVGIPYVERLDYVGKTPVGSMYSYGVALEFDRPGAAKEPENLRKFDQLVGEIQSFRLTKKVSSLLDIVKDMNQVLNAGDPDYYGIPEERDMIAQLLLLYENAGGAEAEKWVDYDYQRLRLMVEVDDYNSGQAARELRRIEELGGELFPDANILLIGSISQFTVMMEYVTWGQIQSLFIALVVIAALMAVVFGSLKTGLIAMVPNLAPVLAVGGVMGFAGIPLDMMTVTVIPMLLGLAVDDTIHFTNHSQLEFERTGSYPESTRRVFATVGVTLLLTSLVLILTFSAYLTSAANVFVNMGFLVAVGILAALAADFFMTPVLLRWFKAFGEERVPGDRAFSDQRQ
ncbi:efflux RND transporter permease subunit [Desulfonatronum thiodismutans]|uniref:efflux RND transporter permease subunit n=1 Tax=Desulfonatronum thiodismutans TaxID=159290 RepID=UPI00068E0736|nr:MMPL family transporter [Desulfonatronum thiodismutans]